MVIEFDELLEIVKSNSTDLSEEFKRVFHGRGSYYKGWEFLTIDSIDTILSVAFYTLIEKSLENKIIDFLKKFIKNTRHKTIILQRRYLKNAPTEIIIGKLDEKNFAIENGIKFKLNLNSNQNSGYFPDMKNGREFIKTIAKGKNVLNLFSYTCGFSLAAILGDAKGITNVDMSKSALSTGRENHHINNLDTSNVNFMPYNILKSWSRIKKYSPYDIIIIDPPSFQKGSFIASNDYIKIIKKLDQLSSKDCTVLACLNAPELDSTFLINLFKEFAPSFRYENRLENSKEFIAKDKEKSLKNLIFIKK